LVGPLVKRWREIEPDQPLHKVEPLSSAYQAVLAEDRANALLISIFGLWALSLACLGLYGLLAYRLSTSVREIAIRMALGAERGRILLQTSRQGLVLLLLGLIAGNGVAIALTRLLSTLLFQVDPLDPGTVVVVNVILVGTSLLACGLPAWRAARLSPAEALRYQ